MLEPEVSLPLEGLRILVVEDNYVLAESMRWALEGLGATVAGPVPTSARALDLLAEDSIDAAILDIDLQGRSSAPVAELLRVRECPFLFLTGYESASLLPKEFHDVRCLSKPVDPEDLASTLLEQVRSLESRRED
jgi:CheY-like chemotaxis protein